MSDTNKKKSALDATRGNLFYMDPDDLILVGGDGPNDVPRTPEVAHLYDPRVEWPVNEAMVQSIMEFGVTQPIIVVKLGERAGVDDGRQRTKNCREANRRLKAAGREPHAISLIIKKGDPSKLLGISLTSNYLRFNDTAAETAEKIEQYIDTGKTEEQAAVVFGMTSSNIKQLRRINDLAPTVLKMVRSGKLNASAALQLVDLPPEEQVTKANDLLVSGDKPTVRKAREVTGKTIAPQRRVVLKFLKLEEKSAIIKAEHNTFEAGVRFMLGEISLDEIGLKDVFAGLAKKQPKAPKAPKAPKEPKAKKSKKAPSITEIAENFSASMDSEAIPGNGAEIPARPFAPAKRKNKAQSPDTAA
jgi:ParB-like chromosome segregation protein Spo0J